MKDEKILLCSHCNKLFDIDDCVWADLDDTREGPHFNCRQNGFGHTCPLCEKKSTNKLIRYKNNGNKTKYMDLGCYSAIYGKAVSRTAQTIGWVFRCPCLSCRKSNNILCLELCTRFRFSPYEPFELREENQPLYNKPRHQYACNISIRFSPGYKLIYFGNLDPESKQNDAYVYVYRLSDESIGKQILLNENTVEAALLAIGFTYEMKLILPSYKNLTVQEFLSMKINDCWRFEIEILDK
jgi:hypothetical protein